MIGAGSGHADDRHDHPRPVLTSEAIGLWLGGKNGGDIFGVPQPPITELAFGDELSHPITVLAANFECCVLPDQQNALIKTTLLVSNEHVHGNTKATLRFPLPDGAVVCAFQLQVDDHMIDAFAVGKQKAAEVAYKEKEKGRDVATTEAVQGSVWSTEVFPLPMGAQRKICITFHCPAVEPQTTATAAEREDRCNWLLVVPLSFRNDVRVTSTVTVPGAGTETHVQDNVTGSSLTGSSTLPNGLRIWVSSPAQLAPAQRPVLRVATCPYTQERHFSALVPAEVVQQSLIAEAASVVAGSVASLGGVGSAVSAAIVWDVSSSRENADDQLLALIDEMEVSHAHQGHVLSLSVYTLSTELIKLGRSASARQSTRDAIAAELPLTYDGGTNLSLLNELANEYGEGDTTFDYVIICSDGIDNFKRRPDMARIPFPCYIGVARGGVHGADSSLLQGIARLSGGLCLPMEMSARLVAIASGAADETTVSFLRLVGLEEEALFDDRVQTVPDARILNGRWSLLDSGAARVCGVLPHEMSAPSEIVIGLSRGDTEVEISTGSFEVAERDTCSGLDAGSVELIGRLLGVSYAVAAKNEAAASQWDPADAKQAAETIMKQYNLASDHTTLLLLHDAVQFVENDLPCPATHPAYHEWKSLAAEKDRRKEADAAKQVAGIQDKLDNMIVGFVKKFNGLLEYKDKHPEQWGKPLVGLAGASHFGIEAESAELGRSAMTFGASARSVRGGMSRSRRAGGRSSAGHAMARNMMSMADSFFQNDSEDDEVTMSSVAGGLPEREVDCAMSYSASARRPSPRRKMMRRRMSAEEDDSEEDEEQQQRQQRQQQQPPYLRATPVVAAADSSGRNKYLSPIKTALATSTEAGYVAFLEQKALPENKDSPSFYLYTAQAFRTAGATTSLCLKIVSNVLERSLCNSQTCRVVAYFLLSIGLMDTAVQAFENVVTVAPEEPQSQTDLAFAKFFRLRQKLGKVDGGLNLDVDSGIARADAALEVREVIGLLCFIIKKTDIPQRFAEIEWPVLILLSWVVDWAEWRLGVPSLGAESFWPEVDLPARKFRLHAKLDIFIWLGWDTDKTDIDLHVLEPTGEECNYSHNTSHTTGASVSRDFTQGYGPECYVLPNAPPGTYKVRTKYYGSHQDSKTTGSTSCVIWSVKHLGEFDKEEALFTSVRLEDHKGQACCFSLDIEKPESVKFTDTDGDVIEFRRIKPASIAHGEREDQIEELVNGSREVFPVTTIGWTSKTRQLSDGTGYMYIPQPASRAGFWNRRSDDLDPALSIIRDLQSLIDGTSVHWVDGEAPPASVVFRGQTLTRMNEKHLLATDDAYAHGWNCDACKSQRGGRSQTESNLTETWLYHGAVEPDNPLRLNAFDLCERCATDIPAAERHYTQSLNGLSSARDRTSEVQISGKTLTRHRNQTGMIDLWCEAGHTLQRFVSPCDGFGCDGCGIVVQAGVELAGCRTCDYDLCTSCFYDCTRGMQ